jgi:hypothetical protein
MKSIVMLLMACLLHSGISAQTSTGILQIQIYPNKLSGTCKLAGVDTVYMHSGLGWSNPDSLWETIVGDWGLNDGKGLMTKIGTDTFSICFNIVDYYTTEADPDSLHGGVGWGPMPAGSTPYNIGAVFRTASCPVSSVTHKPECAADLTGKDENCENILIVKLNDPVHMKVEDYGGVTFSAVSAKYITACAGVVSGIADVKTGISGLLCYPVPFNDVVSIQFTLYGSTNPKAEIFNMLGQKIADFSNSLHEGQNYFTWDGADFNGKPQAAGFYIIKITNNNQSYSGKLIKQ